MQLSPDYGTLVLTEDLGYSKLMTTEDLGDFFSTDGSSVTQVNGSTGQMTRNAWHHVAFTRGSNVFKVFLDGIEVGSANELFFSL